MPHKRRVKEYIEKEEEPFSDMYDIVKELIGVHGKAGQITTDYVLAKLSEQQKTYIRNQYNLAIYVQDYIKDQKVAKDAYNRIMGETYIQVVLERNKKDNPMVMQLIKPEGEPDLEEEATGLKGAVKRLFGGKPKEKIEAKA